jgi:hypothetical protein
MLKILIVCYYDLRDYFFAISKIFTEKYKFDVIEYPLYMYCYDKFSKIEKYDDHFSEFISENKPDIILWWFLDVKSNLFVRIKNENKKCYFVTFNSFDPTYLNMLIIKKLKIFDLVFIPSKHNRLLYENKDVIFFPMGNDNEVYREMTSEEMKRLNIDYLLYKQDISFVCESMYEDFKNQCIERSKLIDLIMRISDKKNLKFVLYGPEILKVKYGSVYGGDPDYICKSLIYNQSKINIVSHQDRSKKNHVNDEIFKIMGCGGIILMDNVRNNDNFFNKKKKTSFIFKNEYDLENKIKMIIKMYDNSLDEIISVKKNAISFSTKFTWENFVELIYVNYSKEKFNKEIYRNIYNIEDPKYETWYSRRIEGHDEICFDIYIPNNFDYIYYIEKNGITKNINDDYHNKIISYIDWARNGKQTIFLKKIKNREKKKKKTNITNMSLVDMMHGFNLLNKSDFKSKKNGTNIIKEIVRQNPNIKINDILEDWIELINYEI